MIVVDVRELRDLENKMHLFAKQAFPYSTREFVNEAAFLTRKVAQVHIRRDFTLRNHWTMKGVQVEKARTLKVDAQVSRVGSLDPYMERQEFGGVLRAKAGAASKPIYTAASANLPDGTQPVTKLPVKRHRLGPRGGINLVQKPKGPGSKKHRALVAIRQAERAGAKHVYLDLGKAEGIFALKGRGKSRKIALVHDMSRTSVRTPPLPWLDPAGAKVMPLLPWLYRRALISQLKRHRFFGY